MLAAGFGGISGKRIIPETVQIGPAIASGSRA